MIDYVGDLSKEDADVLGEIANSPSIVEFGVGASTQILAHYSPSDCNFISVDTDKLWIDRTAGHLSRLGLEHKVKFKSLSDFVPSPANVVFVDGEYSLRSAFSESTWPMLAVGGILAIHDTRREDDIRQVLTIITRKWKEIQKIEVNYRRSNITLIFKSEPLWYQDWNIAEGRPKYQKGDV